MKGWKQDLTEEVVGADKMLHTAWEELCPLIEAANKEKIEVAGGIDAWLALSLSE